jgi:hypothetical protein
MPPRGTEGSVASIVFALIGQSEARINQHTTEIEKLGAGLQDLHLDCTEMLSVIRPDPQRAYLFDSLLQEARGRAEEVKRTNLEQLIQQERDLQASYQRILDEGLPMISGGLDPNRGSPRGWEHGQAQGPRRPQEPPRRPIPMTSPVGPPQRFSPPREPNRGGPMPGMPQGSSPITAAYSSAFKKKTVSSRLDRAASKDRQVEAAKSELHDSVVESKPKYPVNGPSVPNASPPVEHDDSDSSTT